jgi:predicted Zn-dependent protease
LRNAVEATPDRSDIKVQLARALLEAGETSEAIDLLKTHMSDPDATPQLLFCLGQAAVAQGDDPLRSAATKGAEDAIDVLASTLRRLGCEERASRPRSMR